MGEGLSLQEPKAIGQGDPKGGAEQPKGEGSGVKSAERPLLTVNATAEADGQDKPLTLSRKNDRCALVRSSPLPPGEGTRALKQRKCALGRI